MSNNIKELISALSEEPFDAELNFKIAQGYENIGQNASAISFYLRAAEYGSDRDLVYCSLLKVGLCLQQQGERDWNVSNSFLQAIQHYPERPEAYYLISKFYEKTGSWQECHTMAELGLHFSSKNLDYVSELVGYSHKSVLTFQKALSAWWIDRQEESKSLFLKLATDIHLDSEHKNIVYQNINSMGIIQDRIAIVLPVRDAGTGRAQRMIRCLNSWSKVTEGLSDVFIIIDEDDVHNFEFLKDHKGKFNITVQSQDNTLMEKINTIGLGIAHTHKYMIFIGDDITFKTPWESRFIEYLKDKPAGLVYGNTLDLPPEINWATHPCITTNLVRAVGFYGCPAVAHNCFDNYWSDICRELGYLEFIPDVIMDHRRTAADVDAIYHKVMGLQEPDKAKYAEYKNAQFDEDLRKIRVYLGVE